MVCGTQVHLVHPMLHVHIARSDYLQFERQMMLGSYCGVCRARYCCLFQYSTCRVDEVILFTFCGLAEYPACWVGEGIPWTILRACRAVEIDLSPTFQLIMSRSEGRVQVQPSVSTCLGQLLSFQISFLQSFLAYCLGLWWVLVRLCLVTMPRQVPCSGPLRLLCIGHFLLPHLR
jgi:hypothetical protein